MVDDHCHSRFKSSVCIGIDCCSKSVEFHIKFVFKVFHDLSEVFLGDERIEVGDVIHGLNFINYCFMYGCVSKTECRFIRICVIYTHPVWYEVNSSTEDVREFVKSFWLYRNNKTMNVTLFCLFVDM